MASQPKSRLGRGLRDLIGSPYDPRVDKTPGGGPGWFDAYMAYGSRGVPPGFNQSYLTPTESGAGSVAGSANKAAAELAALNERLAASTAATASNVRNIASGFIQAGNAMKALPAPSPGWDVNPNWRFSSSTALARIPPRDLARIPTLGLGPEGPGWGGSAPRGPGLGGGDTGSPVPRGGAGRGGGGGSQGALLGGFGRFMVLYTAGRMAADTINNLAFAGPTYEMAGRRAFAAGDYGAAAEANRAAGTMWARSIPLIGGPMADYIAESRGYNRQVAMAQFIGSESSSGWDAVAKHARANAQQAWMNIPGLPDAYKRFKAREEGLLGPGGAMGDYRKHLQLRAEIGANLRTAQAGMNAWGKAPDLALSLFSSLGIAHLSAYQQSRDRLSTASSAYRNEFNEREDARLANEQRNAEIASRNNRASYALDLVSDIKGTAAVGTGAFSYARSSWTFGGMMAGAGMPAGYNFKDAQRDAEEASRAAASAFGGWVQAGLAAGQITKQPDPP